jgi:predicted O-methyltransferase YrrM
MGQIVPDAIEHYLATLNRLGDPLLAEIERDGRARQLPLVDAETGGLLHVLAAAVGAKHALELGTAIGYSSIWIGRALPPGGMLLTMEIDDERAREARQNIARAGLSDRVNVMVGDAALLVAKVAGPFDFIFQDGHKRLYEPLLDRLIALLRPGGILVTDNVLWEGQVVPGYKPAATQDPTMKDLIVSYNQRLAAEPRLRTSTVPLRDGVAISVKVA